MDAVFGKVVILLALTGMLGVLGSPASGAEQQLVPLTTLVAVASPTSAMPAESISFVLHKIPRQLIPPNITDVPTEWLPTISSILASTPHATTLHTMTINRAVNQETAAETPGAWTSPQSNSKVKATDSSNINVDTLTDSPTSTISFAVANRDPFTPTCRTSALRALWSWRWRCDRSPKDHMKHQCWNRAPSIGRCCEAPDVNVQGLSANEAVKEGAPGTCKQYWPKGREEEFTCCGVERAVQGDWGKGSRERWGWCEGEDGGRGPDRGRKCGCVEEKCGEN